MDLDDDEWMNADLSAKAAPEPVMQTCDEDDQAAMESVLSAIAGAEKDDREEEVRRPATLASMDFDDDMLTGSAGEGGFEPVMQTCDEDDQAAMESVLFRFNARNEIESVEEKRKPSTLASIDFDDDMFVGSGDGAPEPVMQTCDEDDQAAMENVLSTFGAKKQDAADDGDDDDEGKGGRRDVLAGCVALLSALALAPTATAADIVDTGGYMSFEELEARARAAYRAKRLDEARDLLTRIIGMEPEDGTWRERRAQVLVDLKQFQAAIEDFDAAEGLYDKDYKSLGLLSNRALAREGLSDWSGAVRDYTECINLSREIGGVPPYVLNSRGNALSSLGRYDEALGDYEEAAKTFQVMHNLSGAIYARVTPLSRSPSSVATRRRSARWRRWRGARPGASTCARRSRRCTGAGARRTRLSGTGIGLARRSTRGFSRRAVPRWTVAPCIATAIGSGGSGGGRRRW